MKSTHRKQQEADARHDRKMFLWSAAIFLLTCAAVGSAMLCAYFVMQMIGQLMGVPS